MNTTMRRLLPLLLLALVASPLLAQETTTNRNQEPDPEPEPPPAVVETLEKTDYDSTYVTRSFTLGAFGGYSMDFHAASELNLPQVPSCCPGFEGGTGGGLIGGLTIAFPMSTDLDLIGRLSYQTSGVTMTTLEPITVRDGNNAVQTSITHELQPALSVLGFEPGVDWHVGNAFSVTAGLRIGTILSATYEQRERLDPAIAYDYDGGSAVRNETSGDIQEVSSLQFGAFVGARYALPLNKPGTIHMVPEVQFAPLFTSIVDGQTWSMNSLRFMLNFTHTFTRVEKRNSPLSPD